MQLTFFLLLLKNRNMEMLLKEMFLFPPTLKLPNKNTFVLIGFLAISVSRTRLHSQLNQITKSKWNMLTIFNYHSWIELASLVCYINFFLSSKISFYYLYKTYLCIYLYIYIFAFKFYFPQLTSSRSALIPTAAYYCALFYINCMRLLILGNYLGLVVPV